MADGRAKVNRVCSHCGRTGSRAFKPIVWQNGTRPGGDICSNAAACWRRYLKKEAAR